MSGNLFGKRNEKVSQYWNNTHSIFNLLFFATAYYGTGGPITVVTDISPPRLTPTWLTAGQELGYTARDPNGHQEVCE